jgi:hypothetical protein
LDRLSLGDYDLAHDPGGGRGHFGVDFIGRHFEQRLVLLDTLAGLLQPLADGAFGHALAKLGHLDLGGHTTSFSGTPTAKSAQAAAVGAGAMERQSPKPSGAAASIYIPLDGARCTGRSVS